MKPFVVIGINIFCINSILALTIKTNSASGIANNTERKLKKMALFFEKSPSKRTANSPISCGISWSTTTIIVVAIPAGV